MATESLAYDVDTECNELLGLYHSLDFDDADDDDDDDNDADRVELKPRYSRCCGR